MGVKSHLSITGPLILVLVVLSLCLVLSESAPKSALVTQLPGFNGIFPSKHYSGYVTIDESHGRKLFYYFVESERSPAKDPVVLWLNGGPGCSSFDGYVYEHGPFNFEKSTTEGLPKMHINPYSWSKVSNIIYLDSPAGTGYSYSLNQSDYVTGDLKTASDTHAFLLKWLGIFQEFVANPFFIAGESFAGIYIPTLASEIIKGLDAGLKPIINLKGYMIGNGVTDEVFDGNALVPFVHGMGLISDDLYQAAVLKCQGKYYDPTSDVCKKILSEIDQQVSQLNMYNILEPCYHGPGKSVLNSGSFKTLGQTERPLPVRVRMFGRAWPLRASVKAGFVLTWPQLSNTYSVPCTDDEVASLWLNNQAVRKALHVEEGIAVDPWELCTNKIEYTHDAGSMIEYHRNLTKRGIRAFIYSGDHDMCVPYTGSEAWTKSLGYKIVDAWRPWFTNNQVAGYTQGYDKNLTFLTIKGSGHTVPEYKPQESLRFYDLFLSGKKV
ncbi:hypothetical protein RND81_01G086400 [Saponaria officinalis]|uniref:Serine carboxypeptidase 1 n=1 Tax=Saponaria officinalis TaxID=3572 RepID=A0AAW1NCL4_SAPOF